MLSIILLSGVECYFFSSNIKTVIFQQKENSIPKDSLFEYMMYC